MIKNYDKFEITEKDRVLRELKEKAILLNNFYDRNIKITININKERETTKIDIQEYNI